MTKRAVLILAVLFSGFALQSPVRAQSSGHTIEEVVVTAQKREESAQDTAVSMSVYTSESLEEKGIYGIETLTAVDTGLIFTRNGGQSILTVRGVSTSNTTETGNPSVPVSIDNFVMNRSAGLDVALFDIERIEVLRGPQGTLFGRSATGGLVNVTSKRPTHEFELSGSVELTNYNGVNVTGVVNMPLSESVQVRVAGIGRSHDGFRNNTSPFLGAIPKSRSGDSEDLQGGRVSLAFQPSDQFDGRLIYQNVIDNGSPQTQSVLFRYVSPDPAFNNNLPLPAPAPQDILHTMPDLGDSQHFPFYSPQRRSLRDEFMKWEFNWAFSDSLTLSLLGGVDELHYSSLGAASSASGEAPDYTFFPINQFDANEQVDTVNHELRLTGSGERLQWQVGAFYFQEENELFSQALVEPNTPQAWPIIRFDYDVTMESKAIFGQASYDITDNSRLTVGARYNEDSVERLGSFDLPAFGVGPTPGTGNSDDSDTTMHLGYDFHVSDDTMVYGKFSTGYKPGGFEACGPFGPEQVETFELGSKNQLRDRTLQLNVAAFRSEYTDQQVLQFVSDDICPTNSITTNAGAATITGIEMDFIALVGETAQIDGAMNWLSAEYDSFNAPPPSGPGGLESCNVSSADPRNCDLAGNTSPQSPDLVLTLGWENDWQLTDAFVKWRLEGRHMSEIFFSPHNYESTRQEGYSLFNTYLTYEKDNWSLSLWARNITDEDYLTFGGEFTAGGAHNHIFNWGAPRTYGIRFSANTN